MRQPISKLALSRVVDELTRYTRIKEYNATVVFVTKSDKIVTTDYHACHAALAHNKIDSLVHGGQLKYVCSSIQSNNPGYKNSSIADKKLYLDYLMNRSPYSQAFKCKDVEWCFEHGFVIGNINTPSNILAAGLVHTRRMWEFTHIVRVFALLVKAGMCEDLAFLLAYSTSIKSELGNEFRWHGSSLQHHAIHTEDMGKGNVLNYINRSYLKLNEPYKKSTNYYGYAEDLFGAGKGSKLLPFLRDNCSTFTTVKVKQTNPFAKAKLDASNTNWLSLTDLAANATMVQDKLYQWLGVDNA